MARIIFKIVAEKRCWRKSGAANKLVLKLNKEGAGEVSTALHNFFFLKVADIGITNSPSPRKKFFVRKDGNTEIPLPSFSLSRLN